MTQQIIITTPRNSGDGTPIATAFDYCNNNFSQLFSRAQVSPPPTSVGSIGDQAGMYAYDSTYFYYCFSNYTGNTTIWNQLEQAGNISATQILNGTSSIAIASANANATVSINGTSNVVVFTSTGANITGVLGATGSINGSAGVSAVGNVQGGNLNTAGQVSASGNIVGDYILGNGSQLTGLPISYSNSNVAAYLPTYTGTLSPSGIYTDGYYYANSVPVTFGGGVGSNYSNANVAAFLPTYNGNLGGTLTTGAQPNVTLLGNLSGLTVNGLSSVTLSPVAASVTLAPTFGGIVTINSDGAGSINNMTIGAGTPQSGAFTTVSASGNVTGSYILGDGSLLTNLPVENYSNANVAAYLPTYTGDVASGNLLTTGQISAAGNIIGQYFIGNGSLLTGITGSGSTYTNANVAAYLPTYTGNLTAGNISVTGTTTSSVVGNVTGVVSGQLYGLVNGINTVYGAWDFGYIVADTYTNPLQWIFAQTSLGNIDMGTITAPASYAIDIGTIF